MFGAKASSAPGGHTQADAPHAVRIQSVSTGVPVLPAPTGSIGDDLPNGVVNNNRAFKVGHRWLSTVLAENEFLPFI